MLVLYFVIGTNLQAVIKLGLSLPETIINVGIHDPKRHVYVQLHLHIKEMLWVILSFNYSYNSIIRPGRSAA